MNILYVCNRGEIGGATKSLLNLILKLSEKGVKAYVITPNKNGYVMKFCKENNIECKYIKYFEIGYALNTSVLKKIIKVLIAPLLLYGNVIYNKIQLRRLSKIVNISNIDIIHTNVNRDNFGIMISKKFDIPNIMHLREFGTLDFECYYLRRNIYKYFNDRVDYFISISNAIEKFYLKKGINSNKIKTIYNGIENKSIIPKIYKTTFSKNFKIIMVGGISENKGQIQVIDALNLIPTEMKKYITIDFYGTGDKKYISMLKYKINKLGLNENITFKGYQENINEIIKNYDIAIMASKSEAFGRVTVEYMMANIAVIASNTGANPELITDKINGLIYRYGDIFDLKDKILYLINNRNICKRIAEKGFIMSKNFTSDINADNIYLLYKKILHNREIYET